MFELDPFQKQAMALIRENHSLLVSAPTGAGKTCIAEFAIEQAMAAGKGAIYTAPIKALSNQKYRDFREKYGDRVGIMTGDVTLNPEAPLLVMTTEIYRNKLFENVASLHNTAFLIFDEIHYIDDPERGTVWEEAIMFSPPHIRFICLSATVPNIEDLAAWINSIAERDMRVIIESNRPVPLTHLFQAQGRIFTNLKSLRKDGYLNLPDWSRLRPKRWMRNRKGRRSHQDNARREMLHTKPNRVETLFRTIEEQDGLPCIYFTFGRKRTEYLAHEMASHVFLKPKEEKAVVDLFEELCRQYELSEEPTAQGILPLVKKGIAYHHAGMLPTVKEVIERLFTSRLLKLIFTTETFALGINMPAKTVVFDELRKFHGTHFGSLRTREYYQMAGRAGRRGMDDAGYVYSRINPNDVTFAEVQKIIYGEPEAVQSQFNASYATILNLYRQYGEALLDIYPKSFHHFQASQKGRKRATGMIRRKIDLLKLGSYIQDGKITSKGEFASCMYGYELPLSELLERGILEHLTDIELNIMLAALVFEPRKADHQPDLDKQMDALAEAVFPVSRDIHKLEKQYQVWPVTKRPFFHLAFAMRAWSSGKTFHEMLRETSSDEGEIVRYFRMVIQLLKLLRDAPGISDTIKGKAWRAMALINRGEVDAEKQLRV